MAMRITPFVRDGERWLAPLGGLVAEVTGSELRIYQQNGVGVGRFPLAPRISGGATTLQSWHANDGILTAHLEEHHDVEVRVWMADGRVHYRVHCPLADPLDLSYFPEATFRGPSWHTFVPDAQDRSWSKTEPHTVTVATAVDMQGEAFSGGDTRWVLTPPPRTCAFQYDDGWLALVLPEALPVAQTVFTVDDAEKFQLTFEHYRQQNTQNNGPEAIFIGGLRDPYEALDELAIVSRLGGETRGPVQAAPWWSRPVFSTEGEHEQAAEGSGNISPLLTANTIRQWASTLRDRLHTADFNIVFDQSWYEDAGDFNARSSGFGDDRGLRALIDELHAVGHRIILQLNPYALERSATVVDKFELDGILCTTDGNPLSLSGAPLVRDFTFSPMRDQFRNVVQRLLGANGLNADGLKLEGLFDCPDPRTTKPYDPTWGSGDELWAKVLAFIGTTAREVKADALISVSSGMPYVQSYTGTVGLNANYTHSAQLWWRRARILTRIFPGTLIEGDGFALFHDDLGAYLMTTPVYGVPTLDYVTQLGDGKPLTDEDFRRVAASWAVYAHAPVQPDQRIIVNPETGVFERYYPDGSLAAKSHASTALVTKNQMEVFVCASEERRIELPITDDQQITGGELVDLDGHVTPLDLGDVAQRPLVVSVPDAGTTGQYMRIGLAA